MFAVGAAGSQQQIVPMSALPQVTGSVTIDGWSRDGVAGYTGPPLIELYGGSAGSGVNGLYIVSANVTVHGLVIDKFAGNGIVVTNPRTTGVLIQGNYIGTNPAGSAKSANGGDGMLIQLQASSNTVGGVIDAARNVVSGNTQNGVEVTGPTRATTLRATTLGSMPRTRSRYGATMASVPTRVRPEPQSGDCSRGRERHFGKQYGCGD